jgi:hypothetical protein
VNRAVYNVSQGVVLGDVLDSSGGKSGLLSLTATEC